MDTKHVFTTQVDVRWGDQDTLGHVNNRMYIAYVEEARIQWFISMGHMDYKVGPILAAVDMTFLKPLLYPASIEVRLYASEAGRTSFRLDHELWAGDVLYAKGSSTLVWVDYSTGKSVALPQAYKDLIPSRK